MQLSDREKTIFEALVELHIREAGPVSSASLANDVGLDLSPASIRNVLHGLEEKGLLQQPHTSAGRIPSRDGYRLFVDLFVRPAQLPPAWRRRIQEEMQAGRDVHEILDRISKLLAGMSSNVGVGLALPSEATPHIRSIELIGLEAERVMAVLTLDNHVVRTEILALGRAVSQPTLDDAARVLANIVADRTPAAARATSTGAWSTRSGPARKWRATWPVRRSASSPIGRCPRCTCRGPARSWRSRVHGSAYLRLLVQILDHPEKLGIGARGASAQRRAVDHHRRGIQAPGSVTVQPRLAGARWRDGRVVGILGPMRMRYSLALALVQASCRRSTMPTISIVTEVEVKPDIGQEDDPGRDARDGDYEEVDTAAPYEPELAGGRSRDVRAQHRELNDRFLRMRRITTTSASAMRGSGVSRRTEPQPKCCGRCWSGGQPPAGPEAPTEDVEALRRGVELTAQQLQGKLKRFGVEPIEARGQEFDPKRHEAILMVDTDTVDSHHVADVVQPGYTLHGEVLRPARVTVAR